MKAEIEELPLITEQIHFSKVCKQQSRRLLLRQPERLHTERTPRARIYGKYLQFFGGGARNGDVETISVH